ncbi:MAG: nitroreductase family protein [Planctomycetota bacterium]|nr:nitroreductase family protein [Planctomycetota bacterium]MEC8733966.1 nitroreductase family protein [Planctomycetota bacterium]
MTTPGYIPLGDGNPPDDPRAALDEFLEAMRLRRTVRHFSDRPVDQDVIERIIATAGTAPSGANKQPWRFVAVRDPEIKREIRLAAEEEERLFYGGRANDAWRRDLLPFGTDEHKPFLEVAPWLIIVFKVMKDEEPGRASDQVYYVNESVGIAVGMLLAAARMAGLATLTHTPSPMKFLGSILGRPAHERPFLVIPIGYPAEDCEVPEITRKSLDRIMVIDRDVPLRPEGSEERLPDLNPPTASPRDPST